MRTDKKTSRDALLTTAFRLFLTKGYDQTSMQDLARASGLSKGAFHHYFPRKQDILEACLGAFFLNYLPNAEATEHSEVTAFARQAASGYAQILAMMAEHRIPLAAYQAFLWSQIRNTPEVFREKQTAFLTRLEQSFDERFPGQGTVLARRFFALVEGTGVLLSVVPPDDPADFGRAFDSAVTAFFSSLDHIRN